MTENQDSPIEDFFDPPELAEKKPNRTWLFVGIGAVLVMCLCLVVAFVIIDPFDLKARLFGAADPIAQMVPDDSFMYVGVNLLEINSKNMRGIGQAFLDTYEDELDIDMEEFQSEMEDALGFSALEDLSPWIGQFAGLWVEDISADMLYSEEPDVVFMVEVRNKNKATQFVDDLIAHLEDNGEEFDTIDISGSSFYKNQDDWSPFVIGLYKDMLVIAPDERGVDHLIRFNSGDRSNTSLAKSDSYKEIIKQLPQKRVATMYINSERYFDIIETIMNDEFYGMYGMDTSFMRDLKDMAADVGISISVIDEGIQFDLVASSVDVENQAFAELAPDLSGYRQQLASYFPEDTFVYLTGYIPEGYFDALTEFWQDQMGADQVMLDDYQESLELFEEEFGIDMERFGRSLEGEVAIGIFDQSGGILSEIEGVPFGLNIMIGINDSSEIARAFDQIHDFASEMAPYVELETREESGYELEEWIVAEIDSSTPALVYGFSEENILITTGDEVYGLLAGTSASLADNPNYQKVKDAFSKDDLLVFYFDFDGVLKMVRDFDPYAYEDMTLANGKSVFGPMTQLAFSTSSDRSSQQHSKVILFIDYEPAK